MISFVFCKPGIRVQTKLEWLMTGFWYLIFRSQRSKWNMFAVHVTWFNWYSPPPMDSSQRRHSKCCNQLPPHALKCCRNEYLVQMMSCPSDIFSKQGGRCWDTALLQYRRYPKGQGLLRKEGPPTYPILSQNLVLSRFTRFMNGHHRALYESHPTLGVFSTKVS